MIAIRVDERACVECELCVDACPTKVLSFDRQNPRVQVAKPAECFGCLSCSEICPAAAIHHDGVTGALAPHRNVHGAAIAARLGTDVQPSGRDASDEELQQAAVDLGLRLVSVAGVFQQTIGAGLPAVGTLAGRTLARHLPRHTRPGSVTEALELVRRQLAPAWEPEIAIDGARVSVNVRGCFVREVCDREHLAPGNELCTLFTQFLIGLLHARLKPLTGVSRLRLAATQPGTEMCRYEIQAS